MMKLIRFVLGKIILFLDFAFSPKPEVARTDEAQQAIDTKTAGWTLYHLEACPFCVKVRRQMKRRMVCVPMKDIGKDSVAWDELMAGGKLDQVPCLRYIDSTGNVQWMYESSDINEFLATL
jgi:hypothetical protein